ncbi:non imprinted in Prader-Willi/Angelman syndrome 2 [Purpureocillium lavendulum]|uniref:Non imprinted in Prader-Willi/Angelman syndrome 2 n=1 Tax=Purpureocillium lavendulum TaxID=1247861 RepID=A0AB34FU69_9HYPO|nr:non imprinted in Prader-Willi/Angelman syndrome 2 [Purpureocillium lavendulum]
MLLSLRLRAQRRATAGISSDHRPSRSSLDVCLRGAARSCATGIDTMDMDLVARSGIASAGERPGYYKAIGIGLAVGSGLFIGTSFVLKKVGLLRANEKYNEVAGEGYGYLKNAFWWSGMTLMILGEILNFVAYAFTDAILVTPLGALSVVITTVLSAIFLKERLSMVGKVACFLCIVGSVVIVMNGPQESSVKNIQEMQALFITPWFLSYAGVIIVGSAATAWFAGPRWGSRNMLVYISICSWIGGLSVVSTQGLGAAIIAWIGGDPQYKHWFMWVLFVFVIGTLLTEIIYLNTTQKALNIFNAAVVTPTYYVYFTSTTIITSTILFKGFKGTPTSIVTVVMGFLTICSGVVLLQLSKSAKDVPDAAVFSGDLDQIHTIAEQEQPETEPKADAIRGTAAIVRRISQARQRMEAQELKRLHEEKMADAMAPINENEPAQYEWDGLRRRRTVASSMRARSMTSPAPMSPPPRSPHLPLGMSRLPTPAEEEEYAAQQQASFFPNLLGVARGRSRTQGTRVLSGDGHYDDHDDAHHGGPAQAQSPMHPVPLTEIIVPRYHSDDVVPTSHARTREHFLEDEDTEYHGAKGADAQSLAPTPPPHSARRQFSFQRVFRRHTEPTEEERMGLVKDKEGEGEGPPAYI